ncbi:MAG: low specificity L-threonine aldolase, partial [Rhodospirillaceae bacterium]|nr:low specificity L-threonine aldolase [Rhodospirillaceae bacterium]
AAGVYALENNIERMTDDHDNAKKLAEGIANIDGLTLEFGEPQTNMIYFSVDKSRMMAQDLHEKLLAEHGVRVGVSGAQRFRAVTHLDISANDIDDALDGLNNVLAA